MKKLSARYRTDESGGLPEEVKSYLDVHFLKQLDNLKTLHPKLLIVFSGGNGLGKTTLSQKIGLELKALVIENDAIKEALTRYDPTIAHDERNVLTWKYGMDLYGRLDKETPNGLVVRDGVIDWYFDRILPIFEDLGYEFFVIGYDVSKEKRVELIMRRGDKSTVSAERLIAMIEEHDMHSARFRRLYTPDILLTDNNLFEHGEVIDAIRRRLQTIKEGVYDRRRF